MTIEIVDFPIEHGGSFHSYVKLPDTVPQMGWFLLLKMTQPLCDSGGMASPSASEHASESPGLVAEYRMLLLSCCWVELLFDTWNPLNFVNIKNRWAFVALHPPKIWS